MSFILQDSGSGLWQIDVTDSGILNSTSVGSGSPIVLKLNDPGNSSSWQIGITTGGLLTTTSISLGAFPTTFSIVSDTTNTTWNLGLTSLGILNTTLSNNSGGGSGGGTTNDPWTSVHINSSLRGVRI